MPSDTMTITMTMTTIPSESYTKVYHTLHDGNKLLNVILKSSAGGSNEITKVPLLRIQHYKLFYL